MFTAALLTIAKTRKQPKCTLTDKEDVAHKQNGILSSHHKERDNAICSNMDRRRDYHTKWSKERRERQIHSITYTWNLKYDTNEPTYETETESRA